MGKRTVGKPRFYADVLQYLKALGYYNHESTTAPDLLNMNPSQPIKVTGQEYFYLKNVSEEVYQLLISLNALSTSGIYIGMLGHSITEGDFVNLNLHDGSEAVTMHEEIVNFSYFSAGISSVEYKGYSLANVTDIDNNAYIDKISFNLFSEASVGAITYGRWFEPSHAFDLGLKIASDYDGISLQKTISGYTYSNAAHTGVPMWGDLPAWTLEKQEGSDYKLGGTDGRRQWDVSLSFLSDDDLFSKATNENKFFTYDPDSGGYTFDESIASFLGLTFNGRIPFIFCPDSSATDLEFALCMIDEDSLSFDQVAYQTWNVSMSIVEVW